MKLHRVLAALSVLLLASVSAFAQLTTGNLTGTVTTAGAPLPGVTVSLAAPTLQGTRTTVTDSNGAYNFQGLPPGDYAVTFTLEGLTTVTHSVKVSVSQTSRSDADMKVNAVTESITVTASSPAVLETQQVQTNITSHLVENLPMGRTLVATTNLAPNVTPTGPNGGLIIAGGQSYDSTFYVDGAVVNEVLRGQPQNLFIEDALQETTVQTGAISAEFGRFTGGVVTAVSKTGGNMLTGSLRDTVERPSWTSQTKFAPFTITSNKLQSQYEGTLGGPIVKDRLWFFGAGRYFNISSPQTFTVLPGETKVVPYASTDKEERLEVKLTGQLTSNHSLTGSYFNISRHQTGNCQGGCLEAAALQQPRSLPNKFYTLNYDGVITKNFFLEGNYAKQLFSFVGGGGLQGPPETNTPIDVIQAGGFANNPLFCGNCSAAEQRNNQNAKLKGTYFWSPKNWGTHNLSVGVEDYSDYRKGNNEQSGSNFLIYDYDTPGRSANGDLSLTMNPGAGLIIWFPILQESQGNKLNTRSLFANDKWDLGSHWSFNVGARYDKNHATNQAGATIANDSKISPRIGAIYDVAGNGKIRLNASYSEYVSKIAEGNVADVSSPAGAGSYLYWYYYGDPILNVTPQQMNQQVFAWFNSVGGTKNKDFLGGGQTSGISTVINGTLKSPGVKEYTVGSGFQFSPRAFLRADYQYRKWNNFYTQIVNTTTGKVFDPLANQNLDLNLVENTNDFKRTYRAIILQGDYKPFNRLDIGGNWTHSRLYGNLVGESSGSGPLVSAGPGYYPEFFGYANANPTGPLGQDQPNKVRAWVSYDQPTPVGNWNFSWLHRYDSGTPYSAVGSIYLVNNSRCPDCPKNTFGYDPVHIYSSLTGNYYFSQRGAYRTDNIQADDLAVNWSIPVSRANFFIEAKAFNVFNRQGVINVNTTVLTAFNSNCIQTTGANVGKRCAGFNPFTDQPVQGVNYVLGSHFGQPVNPTGGTLGRPSSTGDVQFPRTFRVSFGLRF
jgi:hypothetical protein